MLRNLVELEITIVDKLCRFSCTNDTPTTYMKEAFFQFQKYIGAVEDAEMQKQAAAKAEQDALNQAMEEGEKPTEEPCQMSLVESNVS